MPTGLQGWKYFKKKFNASAQDAEAILNLISSCCSLEGMYASATAAKFNTHQEQDQHIENLSGCTFSLNYVLLQFFNIDRNKYPNFDPVELKDSLGYDERVAKLFK